MKLPKYSCPVCKGEVIPVPEPFLWGFRWACVKCGRYYGGNISKPNFLEFDRLTLKQTKERTKEFEKAFLETILNKIMTVKKDEIEEDRREFPDEDERLKDTLEDIATSKERFLDEVGCFDLDEFASEKLGDLQHDLEKILKAKYKKEE